MTKEVLKLALEALEKLTNAAEGFSVSGVYFNEELWARKCLDDAYDAMGFAQEALAQPEQEPVGVVDSTISGHIDWLCTFFPKQGTKLYTTPSQRTWVGLNEREVDDCYDLVMFDSEITPSRFRIYQAIEAKLKEKNT